VWNFSWGWLSALLQSTMAVAHEWTHLGFEPTTSSSRAATKNYKAPLNLKSVLCKGHWIFILYKTPHAPNCKGELQLKSVHSKLKWQNSRHKILLRGPWSFSVRESLLGASNILLKWNTYKSGKNCSKGI